LKILVLQLKRIGDLVLTTPLLSALKAWRPESHVALGVHNGTAGLLPLISQLDSAIVFGQGRGWSPWQQVLTGSFDVVLDLTGTDRSAAAAWLSRAPRRATFEWVRDKGLRRLAYSDFVKSSVRERHTTDHNLDLARALTLADPIAVDPQLTPPQTPPLGGSGKYIVIHPFTARPEKNWSPKSWADVATSCSNRGFDCVLTGGDSAGEKEHHERILNEAAGARIRSVAGTTDLVQLCGLIAEAELVISCDTAAVHLAAAYTRPQIALFGPTNPFHWRPRHLRSIVISAAQPGEPMTEFDPRMKGGTMDRISTATVCRAIDTLLAK
jgi:ADP-heptose:LPS heptosyltransferase